jgi:Arc/MetJ-type ribon-helix-helix transcriptional regulator
MPPARPDGQKQILVGMKQQLLDTLDENLAAMGFSNRADFIRKAVAEKLQSYGFEVDAGSTTAASRKGKGGRPKKAVNSPPTLEV